MAYPSVYRAKVAQTNGVSAMIYVPQVFGETAIVVRDSIGALPTAPGMGWVFFQAGNPEFPVWMGVQSGGTGGDGGDDEVWVGPLAPPLTYELWVDTDAVTPPPEPGGGGIPNYVHHQTVPAATWTISHNLGWYPNVTVFDSAGATVEGDITQVNTNQMTILFSGAFTGVAYLS
jgi:hypothetical protein